jgi:iron(III) transport system ATP-binding protein
VIAVNDFTFEIPDGQLIGLLGSSGCGKSTTLNLICGLEAPTEGRIIFGEEDVTRLPPENRGVGLVFQNYALYPHMTVLQNILFPLQNLKGEARPSKEEMLRRAEEAARLVQIDMLLERRPAELSGGQQQRVAIARALVTEPAIICMDEPLSNLDAKLRVQLRNELKQMQKEFGITTIYVTHDQEEALTLSDRIAVFNKGYIEQIGTPNEVYNFSKTEFVCNFIGDINRLSGPVVRQMIDAGAELKETWHNYIRLERMHVNVEAQPGQTVVSGTVTRREYYGLYIKYYIDIGCQTVKVIEKNDGVRIYEEGQQVSVVIDPRDVMAYPPGEKGAAS